MQRISGMLSGSIVGGSGDSAIRPSGVVPDSDTT
jgi:hypothetical protein